MKYSLKYLILALFLPVACCFTACDTDIEAIDQAILTPDEQDPEQYEAYCKALRDYKSSEHYVVLASLDNAPQVPGSEKVFLRSLPDSLDIVTLANADNLSAYDIEDIPQAQRKGTKILYAIDYNARSATMDAAAFGKYLDQVAEKVAAYGFDGITVTYDGPMTADAKDAAAAVVGKFAGRSLLLVWEGNPLFIPKADHDKFAYCILNTLEIGNTFNLRSQIDYAVNFAGVPMAKLIVSADPTGRLTDDALQFQPSVLETAKSVITMGPLAGLGVYHVGEDYFDAYINYRQTKQAIGLLNPAAK
ncbi:glycoside hydrolase family 18 [Alistipes sp.]|uniref:glycoside hydrolase family 18 n=1 Tax=Alistipes sp. TaxID=1872444 RepID=UPI003AF0269C